MPGEELEMLAENPSLREAVAVVLDRTNGGETELQWDDVSDVLSSGQWGRLIQEGVLVGGSSGFTVDDPDDLQRRLDGDVTDGEHERPSVDDDVDDADGDDESSSWAWYDKAAGVGSLVLFAGYWNPSLRDVIASVDDLVLSPLNHVLPFYVIVLLLAVVTGLYSTILQSQLMDTEKMQEYREQMQQLKERKQAAKERDDQDALDRIQDEQMEAAGDQIGMFKLQFRPMVWIMLLTIPVFLWLRWKVRGGHLGGAQVGMVVPLVGHVSWQDPVLGPMSAWIVWYFLCSMAARQLIQKTLNVQVSPS